MGNLSAFDAARPGDFGVLGDPVAHSLSPAMQNAALAHWWQSAGRAAEPAPAYRLLPVAAADVPEAIRLLRDRGLAGANVTVPHKASVVPHLDDLHAFAAKAGAVNTIRNQGGRLTGYNTDGTGFERAMDDLGVGPDIALVLGAGGTGQVIVQQLIAMEVRRIYWWNRTPDRLLPLLEKFPDEAGVRLADDEEVERACRESDLIVNATSVGLRDGDGLPAPGVTFSAEQAAFDVVYHRPTSFLQAAEAAGALACGGLPMLLHQGAAAFEIWTGENAPVDLMRKALEAALKEKGITPIWPSAI